MEAVAAMGGGLRLGMGMQVQHFLTQRVQIQVGQGRRDCRNFQKLWALGRQGEVLGLRVGMHGHHMVLERVPVEMGMGGTDAKGTVQVPRRQRGKLRVLARPAEEVDLCSDVGVSYELLRDQLAGGEWEAADAETRRLLCVLAGESAAKRKWVYFSEVQFIPVADLRTVDGLWRAYSGGKFGYTVQRRIWRSVDGSWTRYFRKVGWTRQLGDSRNDTYKKFPLEFMWDVTNPTPTGHLPLTNALRGTRLLEKLLSHPAFLYADDEQDLVLPDSDISIPIPHIQQPQQQQQQSSSQRSLIPPDLSIDYGF